MAQFDGSRPGPGRPRGTLNRLTVAMVSAANAGTHPFEFLLSIMRDETQPTDTRISAAKAALPFCAHRLSSVEVAVEESGTGDVRELTDAELYAMIQQELSTPGDR